VKADREASSSTTVKRASFTPRRPGNIHREIRILNNTGVAGHVSPRGRGSSSTMPTKTPLNRSIDEQTGYVTKRSSVFHPDDQGEIIGAASLNKKTGRFTTADRRLLEAMTTQAAIAMQSTQFVERMKQFRRRDGVLQCRLRRNAEIDLGSSPEGDVEATRMLNAERATSF